MATDTAKVLETLGKMTVLELVELKKAIEEEWGVTAAAPMAVAAPGAAAAGGGDGAAAAEEKTSFDVVITAAGRQEDPGDQGRPRRHRPRPEGGEGPRRRRPGTVKEGVNQEEADSIKAQLEEAGAGVELK